MLLNHIGAIYEVAQVDPQAAAISIPYLRMCSYGLPALLCFFCLRFLADGMSFTRTGAAHHRRGVMPEDPTELRADLRQAGRPGTRRGGRQVWHRRSSCGFNWA